MHSESRRRLRAVATALTCFVVPVGCSSSTPNNNTPDAPTVVTPDAPGTVVMPDAPPVVTPDAPGTATGFSCTSGTLFAGDPTFDDPSMRPTDGTGLLQDPPLPYRMLVFSNGQVITHDGQEIWRADLADGKLHKIAGDESAEQALITGPCAGARFANINGIALASDGSLFISDQTANTILKMTHPLAADCSISHYAGTPTDIPDGISPGDPPNVGNVDGAGSVAKFAGPQRPAVDAQDNVYVWDEFNDSIRRIASDADHTVSTFVEHVAGGEGALITAVALGGSLYVYGLDADHNIFIEAVDLTTKAKHDLLRGGPEKFGAPANDSFSTTGIITDGVGLIVFFNGQLFYVKTNGNVSAPIAGMYITGVDLPDGYDPTAMHAAADLALPLGTALVVTTGAEGWLAIDSNQDVYVSGSFLSSPIVEKISCGK
jgi:hypothetical protein